jgi:hypothetical protein
LNNIRWVDNIAEGFGHFAAVGISDHGMAKNLLEGHFTGEVDTKENHASHPEEKNVPSGFENRGRVKGL